MKPVRFFLMIDCFGLLARVHDSNGLHLSKPHCSNHWLLPWQLLQNANTEWDLEECWIRESSQMMHYLIIQRLIPDSILEVHRAVNSVASSA